LHSGAFKYLFAKFAQKNLLYHPEVTLNLTAMRRFKIDFWVLMRRRVAERRVT